jgi:hypothetical protein
MGPRRWSSRRPSSSRSCSPRAKTAQARHPVPRPARARRGSAVQHRSASEGRAVIDAGAAGPKGPPASLDRPAAEGVSRRCSRLPQVPRPYADRGGGDGGGRRRANCESPRPRATSSKSHASAGAARTGSRRQAARRFRRPSAPRRLPRVTDPEAIRRNSPTRKSTHPAAGSLFSPAEGGEAGAQLTNRRLSGVRIPDSGGKNRACSAYPSSRGNRGRPERIQLKTGRVVRSSAKLSVCFRPRWRLAVSSDHRRRSAVAPPDRT